MQAECPAWECYYYTTIPALTITTGPPPLPLLQPNLHLLHTRVSRINHGGKHLLFPANPTFSLLLFKLHYMGIVIKTAFQLYISLHTYTVVVVIQYTRFENLIVCESETLYKFTVIMFLSQYNRRRVARSLYKCLNINGCV